jgi:hypothetical protein
LAQGARPDARGPEKEVLFSGFRKEAKIEFLFENFFALSYRHHYVLQLSMDILKFVEF